MQPTWFKSQNWFKAPSAQACQRQHTEVGNFPFSHSLLAHISPSFPLQVVPTPGWCPVTLEAPGLAHQLPHLKTYQLISPFLSVQKADWNLPTWQWLTISYPFPESSFGSCIMVHCTTNINMNPNKRKKKFFHNPTASNKAHWLSFSFHFLAPLMYVPHLYNLTFLT